MYISVHLKDVIDTIRLIRVNTSHFFQQKKKERKKKKRFCEVTLFFYADAFDQSVIRQWNYVASFSEAQNFDRSIKKKGTINLNQYLCTVIR
jgi:hypothetical protein